MPNRVNVFDDDCDFPRGTKVRSRKTKGEKQMTGITTGGTRRCGMLECPGTLIGVRWPDGKMTWPCTKGMVQIKPGHYEIN